MKHGDSKVAIRLRAYSRRRGPRLFRLLHLQFPLFHSLPGRTLLCISQTNSVFSLPLHCALTFCFLTACLLFFASFFLLISSPLSLNFLLSLSFSLSGKFILLRVSYQWQTIRYTHTCSFFLAAASNAFVAADLKLLFEALLCTELVLTLLLKPWVDPAVGAPSDS